MSLRRKLLTFDEGMTVYNNLETDEEDILITFAQSLYITITKIGELLPAYLDDLDRHECKEVLGIDYDKMTSVEYLMKEGKLKRDMVTLSDRTLKERGIECMIKGFKPVTTMDLYHAIEKGTVEMAEMLKKVHQKIEEAPITFFGKFYCYQKSLCDIQPVQVEHGQWKKDVGSLTFDLLKDRQTFIVAQFLKRKILRFTQEPSQREIDQEDLNKVRKHLPYGYVLPEDFPICCARFRRFIDWDGDILKMNYDLYGNYLFQYFYDLSDEERQSIFQFDIMLQLIHQEMTLQTGESLSDPQNNGEATSPLSPVEEGIRQCIAQLMTERYDDKPLFNLQGHWQAVYRILVDKEYCQDSDYNGFDVFIKKVMPKNVNKPYKRDSVRNINKTDFNKPFAKWEYSAVTSGKREPYDRMVAVASRFKAILEEKGL
jgi:hypothetical protein